VQLARDRVVVGEQDMTGLMPAHRARDPPLQCGKGSDRRAAPDEWQQGVAAPAISHHWVDHDLLRPHIHIRAATGSELDMVGPAADQRPHPGRKRVFSALPFPPVHGVLLVIAPRPHLAA